MKVIQYVNMNNCAIIPQVKNKDGELVDSKLFTDLLRLVNRDEAKRIYILTKSQEFKDWFKNSKLVDENGEPRLFYHRSKAEFTEFAKISKSEIRTNKLLALFDKGAGYGYYFTPKIEYINGYGDFLYPVFISAQKVVMSKGDSQEEFRRGDAIILDTDLDVTESNFYELVVYKAKNIKSIFNNGQFSSLTNNMFNKIGSETTGIKYKSSDEVLADYSDQTNEGILNSVINITNNESLKDIASLLINNKDKISNVNFSIQEESGMWLGKFYPNEGAIEINVRKSLLDRTSKEAYAEAIIHEYVHAFTISALNNPKTDSEIQFAKDIDSAYKAFKRTSDSSLYGFTNQYEFVAELMSNPRFVEQLGAKNPSIFNKIITAIKNLLGINSNSDVEKLIRNTSNFINNSTPELIQDPNIRPLEKRREGVIEEINTYASGRIDQLGNIKPTERFMLQVHKKMKFNIGKINKKIADINKELKRIESDYKKEVRSISEDYTKSRNGQYDEGYKNSPLYKTATTNYENEIQPLVSQLTSYETQKSELTKLLSDLEVTPDITVNEANYITLASDELSAIAERVDSYDLDTPQGQSQLAEDYLFTRLVTKTHEISKLQESASSLTTQLLENISKYISTISDQYLNTSGLGENIKIDVESILETNDDITHLGKLFEGFGDYPRLEAQLIHNITMNGKEKARLASLNIGQQIVDHMKNLQTWAKRNKLTNLIGQGSIRKAYAFLVDENHLGRLDLVKPFTNSYYEEINNQFKIAYGKESTEQKIKDAKKWLSENYYTKPTSGKYINRKYIYIQNQSELKGFYDFFKETMKDNYSKLPDYIDLKNEEKIPSLIRNSFWEFFSMRKDNIFKSTLLALKTILIGQGRAEFYDEAGNPKAKFALSELSSDEMKLRMIGEVRADIKSFDLGHVLFEFTSFVNDYSEMMEVLPKVRMIQSVVETKEYVSQKENGIFGIKKRTVVGGQSRMYDAINMYVDGKIKGTEESPKWRIGGGLIYDNEGNEVGKKSYYISDMIRSLIKYTRVLQLGFNPFSGINNVLAGLMGDMIEASGGKYFTKGQLLKAISIYTSNTVTRGTDKLTGDKVSSKLALLSEYLQPLEEIGEWQDKRKLTLGSPTLVGKAVESITSNAFIFQEAGEDFVQKITMIAYLLNKKTPAGSSYWSMIDVKNGELVYKNEDNFDTKEEVLKSRNTILDINHAIHGNYSKDNASVYDGALLFDSALVFKKWMPYMIRTRFMAKRYNYRTGKTDEGFYRGGSRAIAKTFNNMLSYFESRFKNGKSLVFNKKTLTNEDIIGVKKIIAEGIMFLTFATLAKILMPPPDDEKDKFYIPDFWEHMNISMWDSEREFDNVSGFGAIFTKSMIDSSKRLSSEAGQMYQPAFYVEAYQRWALWSTLTEGWDVIRETFKVLMADDFDDPDLRYKSGPRKGSYRLGKEITDVVPYYKQIERAKQNGKKTIEELNKY